MFLRALLLLFLILLIILANGFINPIPQRRADPDFKPVYGTSFSFEQAGWYGLNGRESYIKLLNEFNFAWIRLPFFWDQMITDGKFNENFEDLKFAVEEAQKRNIKVIIALGVKTPYFPELHLPGQIRSEIKFAQVVDENHPIADEVLKMDARVVEELSTFDNISYWQVENEPLVGVADKIEIDPSFIAKEVEVVRNADSQKRPVILNHAGVGVYDRSWRKLLPILREGDVFAANAFFKTKGIDLFSFSLFGKEFHILWPDHLVWPVYPWGFLSPNLKVMKKAAEEKGIKFWIMEMQSEPYIKKLDEANDPLLTFTPEDIKKGDNFLRSYDVESIGLWGASFWLYKGKNGDNSFAEAVKSIVE